MGSRHQREYERVTETYGPLLGRIVESYTSKGADRDDLSQEIGLAIFRALKRFRGDCSEKTFIIRIAHNRGLHFVFKRPKLMAGDEFDIPDGKPNPEQIADVSERRELLLVCIRTLPVGYRQVLTLALEDLSHQEISEIVGISVNNVAVRLNRARSMVNKKMEKYYE
ncbi:MAG: sigma-70 family RNA polymerase sigma factor [Proteobacteria bacterium]|nr:sigma-70 family RNA polymerase sigma factor [Pseudomonadota bacterium]